MDVQLLDWDSQFFGFKTARLLPSKLERGQLEHALQNTRTQGMRLVYWNIPNEAPYDVSTLGGRLVDRKTTFVMDLARLNAKDANPEIALQSYQPGTADEVLYNLALQAGEYSRFARDPQFPQEKFQALYREWMRKCLTGELAAAVLAAGNKDHPSGMVTLSDKGDYGEIGLIAVDSAARGKHLGEELVRAAQRWYLEHGLKRAQVVTQGDNLPACNLYRKCGYVVGRVEYFYHFWL
jgi:dTDP-4-amino-4,6-dideoxy-D-galactose acyltransferase